MKISITLIATAIIILMTSCGRTNSYDFENETYSTNEPFYYDEGQAYNTNENVTQTHYKEQAAPVQSKKSTNKRCKLK